MAVSESGKPFSPAEVAFADYLRRRETGEEIAFDAFLSEHAGLEADLRKLERNWQRVRGIMGRLVGTDSDEFARRSEPRLPPAEIHERLKGRRTPFERYRIDGEIGRGGMGKVVDAWDSDLRRHVAMKVALEREKTGPGDASERMRRLARFLEEAQITGQLDHPGIVPVHELGLDDDGKLYFTLKLVRGRDLRGIFELVRTGAEGWSQTRALGVLLRVCEAMAFAHERGVVHRDLKPSNIMVGRHGETYVMDWGLARVLGEEDTRDLRVVENTIDVALAVASDRFDASHETPGSPLLTVDGEVIGTPQYMPPEQAQGDLERIGPPSDVYSLGAILYELLAGKPPYLSGNGRASPQAVWRRVIEGPPKPIGMLALKQPAELVAICEKAMARPIEERYADMSELAEDLRAYLEHRVVRAHRTGAFIELRKWIERNKVAAALLCTLGLVVAAAGYVSAGLERARLRERLERLSRTYVEEADRSWPIDPESIPSMQRWLDDASDLVKELPALRGELAALCAQGIRYTDAEWKDLLEKSPLRAKIASEEYLLKASKVEIAKAKELLATGSTPAEEEEARQTVQIMESELPGAQRRLDELQRRFRRGRGWSFSTPELTSRYEVLAEVVANLEDLARETSGAIARTDERLRHARELERRTIREPRSPSWDEVRSDVAADERFHGLELRPQIGLVPLRRHPESGWWEFWVEPSGERPVEDERGAWAMQAKTGIVLILLPGGKFVMGAQNTDPTRPNYDSIDHPVPAPEQEVDLGPFFLSKHEMTQAQWESLTGERPSTYRAGHDYSNAAPITQSHPVESVPLELAVERLSLWGLGIPTEAQWEYAARSGHDDPYGGFVAFEDLPPETNIADRTFISQIQVQNYEAGREDGWVVHAPVDRMETNYWGFLGMFGNVSEWTRDLMGQTSGYATGAEPPVFLPGTGERRLADGTMQTYRGGNYQTTRLFVRVTARDLVEPKEVHSKIGIRPCRPLDTRF